MQSFIKEIFFPRQNVKQEAESKQWFDIPVLTLTDCCLCQHIGLGSPQLRACRQTPRVTASQLAVGLIDAQLLRGSKQTHDNVFILFSAFTRLTGWDGECEVVRPGLKVIWWLRLEPCRHGNKTFHGIFGTEKKNPNIPWRSNWTQTKLSQFHTYPPSLLLSASPPKVHTELHWQWCK